MKVWALVLLFAVANAKHEQYQGWKSYFVKPSDKGQLLSLNSMIPRYGLDFISQAAVNRDGVVLVKPKYNQQFVKELADQGIAYKIHANDVKTALDLDDQLIEERRIDLGRNNAKSLFDNYLELEEINAYLEEVAEKYPDLVTLVTNTSFEGRPLNYLKISKTNFEDEEKRVIVIDGGIHAREWISSSTVIYAIHKLVEDLTESDLLDELDWILLPVANPDGYKYTFTDDRLWSKTRSTDQHFLSPICPGVDANSNFDFFWNTFGTSNNPCDNNYAGGAPFSEKEIRAVNESLLKYLHRIILYISMHSYGSLILYPWGHDGSLSNHAFALQSVGVSIANAIYDTTLPDFPRYIVGNSVLVTGFQSSGSSVDLSHLLGIPLTFNIELPGIDGTERFLLDPKHIEQVAKETWAGIVIAARRADELFG